ncbi:hypothetical protein [Streptomyces aidingensis]|uniref:Uncharacterized protein n=1 Tax=Streptomyces aidingensis TaxID=910347 RepID=A0A1I1K3X3_9ACTN|nr:hypothetical protein [Streptomyces aidingensis]SFC55426.1 hypothetical protein SAMN05421773_10472 [Streptomyces aidingensis]
MDGYTIAWLVWLAAFGVIEGTALLNKREGDTLGAHVWKWAAIKGDSRLVWVRRGLLVAFLAWLSAHFLTGGRV